MQSKVNRVVFATVAALLGFAAPAQAATSQAAPAHGAPASGPYTWKNTTIVAGGFVDGLVFSQARPGLAYARTDIGGAYRWDPAGKRWVPLLDFTGFNDWNELGVESIAADPVDPAKGYPAIYLTGVVAGVQGVFRSTDEGNAWTRINDGAEQWAWIGQTITGDPNIFGRVYLGTNGRGILYGDPKPAVG